MPAPTPEQLLAAPYSQILEWMDDPDPETAAVAEAHKEYRINCQLYGDAWKSHATNGGDRPPTTPPNP